MLAGLCCDVLFRKEVLSSLLCSTNGLTSHKDMSVVAKVAEAIEVGIRSERKAVTVIR